VQEPVISTKKGTGLFAVPVLVVLIAILTVCAILTWSGAFGVIPNKAIMMVLTISMGSAIALALLVIFLLIRVRKLISASGADNHAAMHDPLTGAANRRHFEQRLGELVNDKSPSHVLMMLDLDRFKPVNDLYGHAAGDALLKEILFGLNRVVTPKDMVARLGGDEFAILLNGTNAKTAVKVALDSLEFVSKYRLTWQGHRISVGTSIGLVQINRPGLKRCMPPKRQAEVLRF